MAPSAAPLKSIDDYYEHAGYDEDVVKGALIFLKLTQDDDAIRGDLSNTTQAFTPTSTSYSFTEEERGDSVFSQMTDASSDTSSDGPSLSLSPSAPSTPAPTKKTDVQRERRRQRRNGTYIPRRPSMKGREYTSEEDEFIEHCYHEFAAKHSGRRIPMKDLVKAQNVRFPNRKRKESGLQSRIGRKESLRTVRDLYK